MEPASETLRQHLLQQLRDAANADGGTGSSRASSISTHAVNHIP